jgi:hypothetical protein
MNYVTVLPRRVIVLPNVTDRGVVVTISFPTYWLAAAPRVRTFAITDEGKAAIRVIEFTKQDARAIRKGFAKAIRDR